MIFWNSYLENIAVLLALFLQSNLLLGRAHIVQKDWQHIWLLSCLSSDSLAQAGVSRN